MKSKRDKIDILIRAVDRRIWHEFKMLCMAQGTDASKKLRSMIKQEVLESERLKEHFAEHTDWTTETDE